MKQKSDELDSKQRRFNDTLSEVDALYSPAAVIKFNLSFSVSNNSMNVLSQLLWCSTFTLIKTFIYTFFANVAQLNLSEYLNQEIGKIM